jgi:multimeric flavodoxin WrbA
MKVLLLNGSPHREGNTATALNRIAEQLSQRGVASEQVWIGTKPVRGCIDCCKCRELHLGQCIFDDDICNVIIRKLNDADGLIVGSPVYYGAPTGAVLSLLQRIFFSGAKVEGKPAAAVTICRRGGATSAFQTLQMPFQMVNMPIVTSQYWNIAYGCSPAEVARDDEGMQTLRTLADNMAWLLRKIHTGEGDLPEREPWTRTNFIR